MTDEAQLRDTARQYEAAEAQAAGRDIAIEIRMRNLAVQGLKAAQVYDMERSYQYLQAIKALMPALAQDIALETREQAASTAATRQLGAEEAQAQQAAREEARIDRQEILILRNMFQRIEEMRNLINTTKGGVPAVRNRLLQDIEVTRRELPQLVNLERREISDETKKVLLRGYKEKSASYNLINKERDFVKLLINIVTEIEILINQGNQGAKVYGLLTRAQTIVKDLIYLNQAEMQTAARGG